MDFIKDFLKNASLKVKLITFGIILTCLAILIVAIINFIITHQPAPVHIDIENFSDTLSEADLPDYYKTQVQQLIWAELKDLPDINQTDPIPATIREGSLKKTNQGRYTILVDIEPLRYSFRVSFSWIPELANQPYIEPGYYVECPYADEIIYKDTRCPLGTPIDQIERYLPIYTTLSPEYSFYVKIETYANFQEFANEQYLATYVNSCGNKSIFDTAKNTLRNKIKSFALDPNDYHIEIIDSCFSTATEKSP